MNATLTDTPSSSPRALTTPLAARSVTPDVRQGSVAPAGLGARLTEREWHVLEELWRPDHGLATTRQVAMALSVAEATVRQHLLHLYRKLGVPPGPERRARLATLAGQSGLAGPEVLASGSSPAGDRSAPAVLSQFLLRKGSCAW